MNALRERCNQHFSIDIDIVLCTNGDHHLVHLLPNTMFHHRQVECDPRFLGYECHEVLAKNIGKYDFYCFMEDDLEIRDALFFVKIKWFTENTGGGSVLQPHRFELSYDKPIRKLYIDGRLRNPSWSSRFQNVDEQPRLNGQVLGVPIVFERTENPHSGCFFLSENQMQTWMEQTYFMDRSDAFAGPLESAASLGLMRTFRVYKPAPENAAFLEVEHLDCRYLGTQLRFPPEFELASAAIR